MQKGEIGYHLAKGEYFLKAYKNARRNSIADSMVSNSFTYFCWILVMHM